MSNPQGNGRLRGLRWGALAVATVLASCNTLTTVEGSSCAEPADCVRYSQCSLREGGCACEGGVCAYDPQSPLRSSRPECGTCHGNGLNLAPPRGVDGGEGTEQLGVGAHQSHLSGGTFSKPVACQECHRVPLNDDEPGHRDTPLPAELVFGPLASTGSFTPVWDPSTATCTSYCHGATLGGGSLLLPKWTQVDGSQAACGTCHGLPPAGDHPPSARCELCHAPTAGPNVTVANRATHADGLLQVQLLGCGSCHGTEGNPAPPQGTKGQTATSDPSVGAHREHLTRGAIRAPLECSECHVVPETIGAPGHIDGQAMLSFGALASHNGATPTWNRGELTCAGSYCHGPSVPRWTQVDGTFSKCDACHGNPPAPPHPQGRQCAGCHGDTIYPTGAINLDRGWHLDGHVDFGAIQCSSCHGDLSTGQSNPPLSTLGLTDPSVPAVGAHQAHLDESSWRKPIACTECHEATTALTHADGAVKVAFGQLASGDGAAPSWNAQSGTCSNVYCHGVTLGPAAAGGAVLRSPLWTQVDGTFSTCGGSCHTNPPGGLHPQSGSCASCHGQVVSEGMTIISPALHIDGKVDVTNASCGSCHGSAQNPAPPSATNGATATTDVRVGAHARHLSGGMLRGPMPCASCHRVPGAVEEQGHLDNAPAEVVFGPLSQISGATPTWTRASATCANDYCHGATLGGGTLKTPLWTKVDGTQAACGTCHGAPPPPPHPAGNDCAVCHPTTVTPSGTINLAGGTHVDGKVDVVNATCTSCHGNPVTGVSAPPTGVSGETATTTRAVGAHSQHLQPSAWRADLGCAECHVVPSLPSHQNGVTEVSFSFLARAAGAAPSWSETNLTCSNTYCHGSTLQAAKTGGSVKRTPVWTQVNGSFSACGTSCHTNPPGGTHVQSSQCSTCHGMVVDPSNNIVNRALHVDGKVDVSSASCGGCHGGAANAAPPVSTNGAVATTDPAVGAHQTHVVAGTMRGPIPCGDCHQVPASASDPGHLDPSPAEVRFSALSLTDGATPSWDRATATCTSSYCHGATLTGGSNTSPRWTVVNGTQAVCGTCHGDPPPSPHPARNDCTSCHPTSVLSNGSINVSGTHIDGKVDVVSLACTSCHGTAATNDPAPPTGTGGETATTSPAVGAHQKHLLASSWHRRGACADCHLVPSAQDHSNGTVELPFTGLARAGGATASYSANSATCTNYCHGATLGPGGGSVPPLRAPVWTTVNGSAAACGTACHTNPPGGTHPRASQCIACHSAVSSPTGGIGTPALHMDGVIQSNDPACNSCHGGASNAAPPLSTTGATSTSSLSVGAHQKHLTDGPLRRAMPCTECHVQYPSVDAPGHLDSSPAEVVFGPLATAAGAAAAWTRSSATCSNYCHGATIGGGTNKLPRWTTVNGTQAVCGSCHGTPPPVPHTQDPNCAGCHPETVNATGSINVAGGKHINGVVESQTVHPAGWATVGSANFHGPEANQGLGPCTTCHGANLDGGTSQVSCTRCHVATWKTQCAYCHGGTDGASGAPPVDLLDRTATSNVTVGAHTSHLSARHSIASPLACSSCHVTPASAQSAGHVDPGPAEVVFGPLAKTGGAAPTWTRATATCANSYCHGKFTGGLSTNTAVWTNVNGSEASCTACHAKPPATGDHNRHANKCGCDGCHSTIVDSAGSRVLLPSKHVNGSKDVIFAKGGTWNATTRSCTPSGCHSVETW